MEREELLASLTLAKPALCPKEFLPILTHFCFSGTDVVAYNDLLAIRTSCAFPVSCAVKGTTLLGLLENSNAKTVEISEVNDSQILVKMAGAKASLPVLQADTFLATFTFPKTPKQPPMILSPAFLAAVDRCMINASSDMSTPQKCGVTVVIGKHVVMFSTDSVTISQQEVEPGPKDKALYRTVMLPTEFCKLLVSTAKAIGKDAPKLYIVADSVMVTFADGTELFGKLFADVQPLDFHSVIKAHMPTNLNLLPIPKLVSNMFARSAVLLTQKGTGSCGLVVADGKIRMWTVGTGLGELDDVAKLPGDHPDISVSIAPQCFTRVLDIVTKFYIGESCTVLADDGGFLHLIANTEGAG